MRNSDIPLSPNLPLSLTPLHLHPISEIKTTNFIKHPQNYSANICERLFLQPRFPRSPLARTIQYHSASFSPPLRTWSNCVSLWLAIGKNTLLLKIWSGERKYEQNLLKQVANYFLSRSYYERCINKCYPYRSTINVRM